MVAIVGGKLTCPVTDLVVMFGVMGMILGTTSLGTTEAFLAWVADISGVGDPPYGVSVPVTVCDGSMYEGPACVSIEVV